MNDDTKNHKESKEIPSIFHQECAIMAEYRMLQTESLPGIYVIPSFENSFLWYGVIFVRSGYYEAGVFRFTLTLPEQFPDEGMPILAFTSQLYHPAVDAKTGILNLNEVFPNWDRKQNHIWHILKYLYSIFHNLNVKVPANVEASVAYKTNQKLFMEKAKESVTISLDHIYDDPPTEDKHYITFKPYNPDVHDAAKKMMFKTPAANEAVHQGISWVRNGSFRSFSKEETT